MNYNYVERRGSSLISSSFWASNPSPPRQTCLPPRQACLLYKPPSLSPPNI